MTLSIFEKYLLIVNIIGFLLYLINMWLYRHTAEGQVDVFLTIVSFLGGSLGIVLAILIFDRKPEKGNMMSRVFVPSILVIQIVIYLIVKGTIRSNLTVAFWEFFSMHRVFLLYLLIINVVALVAFALDKIAALERRPRIRIVTLLALAFFGGSLGALVGMYLFRHKTRKDYFSVGVPLMILMQAVVLFYLMNADLHLF